MKKAISSLVVADGFLCAYLSLFAFKLFYLRSSFSAQ